MLTSLVGSFGVTVMYISDRGGSDAEKNTWFPRNLSFCVAGKHAIELFDAQDRSAIGAPDSSLPVTATVWPFAADTGVTLAGHPVAGPAAAPPRAAVLAAAPPLSSILRANSPVVAPAGPLTPISTLYGLVVALRRTVRLAPWVLPAFGRSHLYSASQLTADGTVGGTRKLLVPIEYA